MSKTRNSIIELIEKIHGDFEEKGYSLALLLVLKEQPFIGRRRLSKILELSERKIRSLIEKLVKEGFIEKDMYALRLSDNVTKYLNKININRIINEHKILMIGEIPNLCNILEEKITTFRDYLVINIKDPMSIEVICCQTGYNIVIPRVPENLKEKYKKLINQYVSEPRRDELIIIWNNYKPFLYDALTLISIYMLFKNI
ncbi:MAG: hypothetical protein J7L82_05285 [Staphylothermus sp.]|nr:hypothetical protein [Staphylothermus sp.]